MYYSIVLFCSLFSAIEFALKNKKISLFFSIIFIVFLCSVAALRWDVGQDFSTYISIYNYIERFDGTLSFMNGYSNIEPGFKLIIALSKNLGEEKVFLFIVCFISLATMLHGIYNLKKYIYINISLSILIYILVFFISYNFNAMRQAISMGFFIMSIPYMFRDDFIKVLLISMICTTFHVTGYLIFFSYFIQRYTFINSGYKLTFFLLLSLFLYIFNPLSFIFSLSGVDMSRWRDLWGGVSLFSLLQRFVLIVILIFPLAAYKINIYYRKLFSIYLAGFAIYCALSDVSMMATRFNMFFRVLEIILVPWSLYLSKFNINKLLIFITYIIIAFSSFYFAISLDENTYNFRNDIF